MSRAPDVTVAICTYNRAALLRQLLESLITQRARCSFEVVVVDNASTDETQRVIAEVGRRVPGELRGVVEPRGGIAPARNRAVAESRGQWIAFIDDDQLPAPDWIDQLLDAAASTGAKCVGGRVELLGPTAAVRRLRPLCRRILGESAEVASVQRYRGRERPATGNLLIHSKVFESVGPFDSSARAGGEDDDLVRRMAAVGIEAWHAPQARTWHVVHPHRLRPEYLTWTSRRFGWNQARGDQRALGTAVLPLLSIARLGWSVVGLWPPWASGHRLELGCRLARALGYAQYTSCALAPRLLSKERVSASLDFRSEQRLFGVDDRAARGGIDAL